MKVIKTLKNPSKKVRMFFIIIYALLLVGPFIYMMFDLLNHLDNIDELGNMEYLVNYELPFLAGQLFLLLYFVAISDWKKLLFTPFKRLDELEKSVLYKIIFMSYMFFITLTILNLVFYSGSGEIVETELSRMIPLRQLASYLVVPILVGFYYDEDLVKKN